MKKLLCGLNNRFHLTTLLLFLSYGFSLKCQTSDQKGKSELQYTVSMPDPSNHYFHVELICSGWVKDTIDFKMPK